MTDKIHLATLGRVDFLLALERSEVSDLGATVALYENRSRARVRPVMCGFSHEASHNHSLFLFMLCTCQCQRRKGSEIEALDRI